MTPRAALAQAADVEVLSGEAAEFLDRVADGIAARLRFAIDGSPTHHIPDPRTEEDRHEHAS